MDLLGMRRSENALEAISRRDEANRYLLI